MREYLLSVLALCAIASAPAAAAAGFEPEKTYAVIAGVLEWPSTAGLTPYAKENRKDRELFDTLARRGVPTNQMTLLVDEQATLGGIRAALSNVLSRATPGSTFVFYYAGHGSPGEVMNYDCATNGNFKTAEIAVMAKKVFKGRNVLLMADCCHSGSLGAVAKDLAAAGFSAACLASADPTVTSSGNWTFSQTIIDALNGSVLFDANNDGVITLGEAAAEVLSEMAFREGQLYGYTLAGLPETWRIAETNGTPVSAGKPPGKFLLKDYIHAPWEKETRVGRIVGWETGCYLVGFYDYSEKIRVAYTPAQLSMVELKIYETGTTVTVLYEGESLPAKVVRVQNGFHYVSYIGWPSPRDEWLSGDRILGSAADRPPLKDLVFVEWHGSWWLAKIKTTDTGKKRYFIHYVGDGDNWDEWVTDARMKKVEIAL